MIKQMWIAECDLCGHREKAKAEWSDYNDIKHELPDGWSRAYNDNFIICPECLAKIERR